MNIDGHLVRHNLAQGLMINEDCYYTFRDHISNLEYIRHGKELAQNGIYVELGGFKYHVFLEFREIQDDSKGIYARLRDMLNGQGVPDIGKACHEMHVKEIRKRFEELTRSEVLRDIILNPHVFRHGMDTLLGEIRECGYALDEKAIVEEGMMILTVIQRLLDEKAQIPQGMMSIYRHVSSESLCTGDGCNHSLRILLLWLILHKLGRDARLIDEWQLSTGIIHAIELSGADHQTAYREMLLIKILVQNYDWFDCQLDEYRMREVAPLANAECSYLAKRVVKQLFEQAEVREYLMINQYQGVWYAHKESLEDMLYWLTFISAIHIMAEVEKQGIPVLEMLPRILDRLNEVVSKCLCLAQSCAYQVEEMCNAHLAEYHGEEKTKNGVVSDISLLC
ncbi:MAG: hypothetical protein AAB296_03815, partial [Candidatus Desantisbacteria bacterium]